MDSKLIRRLCFWAIGATTLVFTLAMASVFFYIRDQLVAQADRDARSDMYVASSLICDRLQIAKTAIVNSALPEKRGESRTIVENLLRHNGDIFGTAIALKPEFARTYCGEDRFMIYSCRTPADSLCTFMVTDSIDNHFQYTERDWYQFPLKKGAEHWSEPYDDLLTQGGPMVSYSAPIIMGDSIVIGVFLADIKLEEGLRSIVEEIDSPSEHHTYLLSRSGQLVFGDTTNMANAVVYTCNIPETGWTLGHVIYKDTLFRPLHKAILNMVILYVLTVFILCFTIYYMISWMTRPAVKKQMRLKAELDVAAHIQKGMLPDRAERLAGHTEIDIATIMCPAKEVGGDFYNYFIHDRKAYFIIGDVAGKGVPSALIMSIATKLFMFSAPGKSDPAEIMADLNKAMCRNNMESMFITAIVGILDIPERRLKLCNAGHTRPILVGEECLEKLQLPVNIPTGVISDYPFEYEEFDFPVGSKLVLYTDGVTEAENAHHEQFGEPRLQRVVADHRNADATQLCQAIETAVRNFTAAFAQSDDIALLILHSHP